MRKVILIILFIVVGFTVLLKFNFINNTKLYVLSKFNNIVLKINKNKELKQTKEHLLNIIDEYEKKLDSYSSMVIKYDNLIYKNNELRSLMEFKNDNYSIIYADILEKSILYDYLIINKGKKDGIKEGSAVISSTAFIGIVKSVDDFNSTISLINNMKYPVMNDSTSEMGMIESYNNGYYIVKDIKGIVNIGDPIVTGKYNINVPSELFIGSVEYVENDSFELSKKLKVKPGYEYNKINSVGVMVK